jgi:ABC-type amino acid transport system permease subunit/photosystem II stability/assembly factor-like uncharacterized protein
MGFALAEVVSSVFNPRVKKKNRLVAILSFLILITLITPAQAVDYNSGWDVADSGTEADLFTVAYDGESVFAFGAGGAILQSANKGATWVQLESPANSDLQASDSVGGAIAVVGDGGGAFLRADGSDTWLDISLNLSVDFRGMAMNSATSLVAVGPEGAIWQYSDDTWMQRDSGVTANLNDVSFFDSNLGMIVGDSGTILATNDGGESWEYREAAEGLVADIVALDYYSGIRAYAVTDEGNIVKSIGSPSGTAVGYVWELVEIESEDRATSLGLELSSIDVSSVNKFLVSGPSGYAALSLDGGNIITSQMNPLPTINDFNHILFLNLFEAVIVGADGVILFSDNAGADESVGFQVIDYGDFGQFVDYSKGMLIDGLFATIRIVLFGIVLGFFLGVMLSMMKTAPTTLKDVAQLDRYSILRLILIPFCIIEAAIPFIRLNEKSWSATQAVGRLRILSATSTRPLNTLALRALGLGMLYYGITLILALVPIVKALNLDGLEYIYTPIGLINPDGINGGLYFGNFFDALLGIGLILLGLLFLTSRKFFLKREVHLPFRDITLKWDFWGTRPLNAVATVYTDLFRNTPLIVQFMFIHFGVQFGKLLGDPAAAFLEGETNFFIVYIRDMILSDRACVSSIFALGLNSGAYQCETIRGAIAAIPSGQMEAGRSIGLNYMQTMGLVIMPQAIRICIPPMGNEMVNLVLNSSLAMVIGYAELTRKGRLINAVTFQLFWGYGMVLVSYFIVTWTLALILRYLENKSRIPGLGISGGA